MTGAVVILVTAGSAEEAERIARTLVEERLVACANLVPSIRSIYRWEGTIADDAEVLLILKTRAERFAEVEARVRALHSYQVPEIVALDATAVSTPYLEWLFRETEGVDSG